MKNKEAIEELRDEVAERQRVYTEKIELLLLRREGGLNLRSRAKLYEGALRCSVAREEMRWIEKKLDKTLKEWK